MNALKEMLALAECPIAVVPVGEGNNGAISAVNEIVDRVSQLTDNMFGIEAGSKNF